MSRPRKIPRFDTHSLMAIDPRVALGAKPLRPGQPVDACYYCLPSLIAADTYDSAGRATCLYCMGHPERRQERLTPWADPALVMLEDAA